MGTGSIKDPHVFLTYFILQHHHYTPTCSRATRNIPANHTRHIAGWTLHAPHVSNPLIIPLKFYFQAN